MIGDTSFDRGKMPAGRSSVLRRCARGGGALGGLLLGCSLCTAAGLPIPQPSSFGSRLSTPAGEPKQEVSIEAPEPRYVAPTLRDRIGRIWAPVLIDGKGPFRLVLDTGASHSAVTAAVAQTLGIPLQPSLVRLRGATGTAIVPAIHVSSLIVGDVQIDSTMLPIVPDALGGAQGVLGTEGLLDKRIFIDFGHDRITIRRSHERGAAPGFVTVPVKISPEHLLTTTAYVGSVRAVAIIDTGAQVSIANLALRAALLHKRSHYEFTADQIVGATDDVADGQGTSVPPIRIGAIRIQGAHITIGDLQIFDVWKLTDRPAILIGMDALGTVDTLIIDYRRRELQIKTRGIY
jgi:predicted aspartyl protease